MTLCCSVLGSHRFSNNVFLLSGGQASLSATDLAAVTFSKIILLINQSQQTCTRPVCNPMLCCLLFQHTLGKFRGRALDLDLIHSWLSGDAGQKRLKEFVKGNNCILLRKNRHKPQVPQSHLGTRAVNCFLCYKFLLQSGIKSCKSQCCASVQSA